MEVKTGPCQFCSTFKYVPIFCFFWLVFLLLAEQDRLFADEGGVGNFETTRASIGTREVQNGAALDVLARDNLFLV